ncbi:MAG: sigma-70 family RNA polymerase sigma factor [Chloroflexi bacterium]|nr:sigma-70 family RNA polymerase sigma factor [Chloroflexota bacterium]
MEPNGAIDDRIIAHLGYARSVAARSLDPRCRGAEREDLIAWGVLGLVQAARRYRSTAGAPFGAYAARRVRGQVLDALRARDPLTRTARREYKAARAADSELAPPYLEVSLDRCLEHGLEPPQRSAAVCRSTQDARWAGVRACVRRLPALERRVIVLSFGRGYTLKEIGARVGLSESGVCRMRARALRRLRVICGEGQEVD